MWFASEAERLMDGHVINDADAMQALLTGHAQVSDPLRAPRQHGMGSRQPNSSGGYQWLKPFWLEADNEPFTTTGGSPLARSRWIRPVNAPLEPGVWQRVLQERKRRGFSWQWLPADAHLVLRDPADWESALTNALATEGKRRGAAEAMSVKLSPCQTIDWFEAHRRSPAVLRLLSPNANSARAA